MTTALDVIADAIGGTDVYPSRVNYHGADRVISAIQDAPASVRLELTALLNPWQLIETAPKNGANFIGWCKGKEPWVTYAYDEGTKFDWYGAPTHWVPLPTPPKEDKA